MGEKNQENHENEEREKGELLPEELSDALEEMPPEIRKHVEKFMISSVQMGGIIRPENEISKKITEEHITEFLEGSKQQMIADYEEKHENKIFKAVIFIAVLIFILIVIVLLRDMPEIMEKVLYTLVGALGGAMGGYGFGKSRKNED